MAEWRRLVVEKLISEEECSELKFIQRSNSTVGYRPNVFSTTLSHLIATNSPHFIIPFLSIRDRLKDKVEQFFACEFELFIEFTGLISWTRGASIGWHTDDNRPYLKQRHFAAVCYLNDYDKDFTGGLFHFHDGHPTTVIPMAGLVAIYTADDLNVHSVDEIIDGERTTLTLWFSRDSTHDEDAKLISLLSENMLYSSNNMPGLQLPMLASVNMYWFSPEQVSHQDSGFDICFARIHVLGFDIYSCQTKNSLPDSTERLTEKVQIARGNELYAKEFVNILHALQVIQFYFWKAMDLPNCEIEVENGKVIELSESQKERVSALKLVVLKDRQLAESVFGYNKSYRDSFNWAKFSCAVAAWEDYTSKLHQELLLSLPFWKKQNIIYRVPFQGF
ncbi:2-oxoglutarate (2OG) and Fe(II)-dependent oxygenase superfamily protein [Euphorbia peplus]|nr:2-oxoglutarate (2OG) and Fe(II)-dependent oxygenase superfamily protein [Euphorbia peplus]